MNKQRPYRGKRVDNGEWVKGWLFKADDGRAAIITAVISDEENVRPFDFVEVDPATVGQFIGHKDKNGVEIYKGDKFKIVGYCVRGPVVFEKGCFGYRDLTDTFTPLAIKNGNYTGKMSDIEVIGNIHDEEASDE